MKLARKDFPVKGKMDRIWEQTIKEHNANHG